jgi:hypothetical protein
MRMLIAVGLLALCAAPLHAAVVSYTASDIANSSDPRPNSNAMSGTFALAAQSLGPTSLITFESAPVGTFNSLPVAPGVILSGADNSNNNQQILNSSIGFPADGYWGYNTTPAGKNFVQNAAGTLTYTFSTPIQSFGAFISGISLDYNDITFTDSSGPQTVHVPNPSAAFGGITYAGFTDAGESITSVTLTSIGDIIAMDDVRFGTVDITPEPGSIALLIPIALAALRRRRRF